MAQQENVSTVVTSTKDYYDGPADEIYRTIWGDNIHLGVPRTPSSSHLENMEYTNELMADAAGIDTKSHVIDLGCGYGATARFLAERYGCQVTGTNISEKELDLARERGEAAGLGDLLSFEYGDFHDLEYPDESFSVVWSQESFLHGVDKKKILSECKRILTAGGTFVFTDILVREGTAQEVRERIYDRVKSPDMWDMHHYTNALKDLGLGVLEVKDWSQYVAPSYAWVRDRVVENRDELAKRIPTETIDRTVQALTFWVDSANAGHIGWGFYLAKKPS